MTKEKFKAKVILTVGISNCGKSTWSKEFIAKNPMFTEVNRDDMRIAFFCGGDRSQYVNYKFSREKEQLITKVAEERAAFAISKGQGVIISDTNLNGKTRGFWSKFAMDNKVPYEEVVFDVPLHVCVSRNRKRDITIPEYVLFQQYQSYRKFKGLPTYVGTAGKDKAIVVDVDGTLADMEGIRKPFEWSKVGLDKPRKNVIEMVRLFHQAGYKVIIMSGRDGQCLGATEEWLQEHGIPYDAIFMRDEGCNRTDAVIKEELFWDCVAPDYDVKFVVDDRLQVINQWRAMGLECFDVAGNDF
ncbi:polynucleotide kinase [Vibrio phage D148]